MSRSKVSAFVQHFMPYLSASFLFTVKKDGKYGYVDKNNVVVVNYIYDDATEQNNSGYVAVKKDGKWGAINSKGETMQQHRVLA